MLSELISIYNNTYISSAIQKLSRVEVSGAVNVVVTCAQLELTARYITTFFLCGAHYRHTSERTRPTYLPCRRTCHLHALRSAVLLLLNQRRRYR